MAPSSSSVLTAGAQTPSLSLLLISAPTEGPGSGEEWAGPQFPNYHWAVWAVWGLGPEQFYPSSQSQGQKTASTAELEGVTGKAEPISDLQIPLSSLMVR